MKSKHLARWLGPALLITFFASGGASRGSVVQPAPHVIESPPTPNRGQALAQPKAPRYSAAADARTFIRLINRSRRARGLSTLSIRGDLSEVALRWSRSMARAERIRHNPRFRTEVSGWLLLGENVGWTRGTVHDLHRAFMASPKHRRNVLDPRFTSIGVAETVSKDGRIFVAEEFGWF